MHVLGTATVQWAPARREYATYKVLTANSLSANSPACPWNVFPWIVHNPWTVMSAKCLVSKLPRPWTVVSTNCPVCESYVHELACPWKVQLPWELTLFKNSPPGEWHRRHLWLTYGWQSWCDKEGGELCTLSTTGMVYALATTAAEISKCMILLLPSTHAYAFSNGSVYTSGTWRLKFDTFCREPDG